MSNEVLFLLITALSLSSVLIAAYFGKYWLYVSVVTLALVSSVTAGKIIAVFGLAASAATPLYAGIFLATDALAEFYGEKEARQSVWLGLYANLILISAGQLIVAATTTGDPGVANALDTLFNFIPRLVAGGLLAYIISQNIDIFLYQKIRSLTKGKHLWLRNNGSTIISQFVDSAIVYNIAFYGIIDDIWPLIWVAYIMKIFVAITDTGFLYLIKKIHDKNKT